MNDNAWVPILDFFRRPQRLLPWSGRIPIATFLESWDGSGDLPDEDLTAKIRYVGGALDGIFGHHGSDGGNTNAARIAREVVRAAQRNDDRSRARLYSLLLEESTQAIADGVVSLLPTSSADQVPIAHLGRWLARHAADREPAKLGLVLIAAGRARADLALLRLYARHDEFTKFAAFAAGVIIDDPVDEWMAMAQRVEGWGKVNLVERIADRGAERADVRDWLLRRGCRNAIMDEYLAFICATAGRLHEAIAAEAIDEEVLTGASTIVEALLMEGGPATDIRSYEQGEAVVLELLRHLDARPSFTSQKTTANILSWIETAEDRGDEFRADVRRRCRAILSEVSGDELRQRLRGGFQERYAAWNLAPAAGVDLWEDLFAILATEPEDSVLYQCLLSTSDVMRLRRVVSFAEEHLPLDAIASGPADEMGLGDAFRPHACLDQIVQRMKEGDFFSPRLVMTALRSPVTRNRNLAAAAIEARQPRGVPAEVRDAVREAARIEPNADTRAQLLALATVKP